MLADAAVVQKDQHFEKIVEHQYIFMVASLAASRAGKDSNCTGQVVR